MLTRTFDSGPQSRVYGRENFCGQHSLTFLLKNAVILQKSLQSLLSYSIPEQHPLQSVVLVFLLFGFTAWSLAVTPSMPCRLADLQLDDPVSL